MVAICDTWEERLREVGKQFNVATCTDYGRFLEHDMDAVILADYFREHAPYARPTLSVRYGLRWPGGRIVYWNSTRRSPRTASTRLAGNELEKPCEP